MSVHYQASLKRLYYTLSTHSLTLLCCCLLLIASLVLSGCDQHDDGQQVVAITQIIEHPALDDVRRGIEDVFKQYNKANQKQLRWVYKNAQGQINIAVQIAQGVVGEGADVIVAIGTPMAQSIQTTNREANIPLVFAAVTDPIAAGLVNSLDAQKSNVTGVMDSPPVNKIVDLMLEMMPNLKTVGLMYNPGEANSVVTIRKFKKLAQAHNLQVVEGPVQKSSDLVTVAQYLMPKVEAIFVPQDNVIVSAMSTLAKVCLDRGIPVFAADSGSVQNGALATFSFSYYQLGQETGRRVLKILGGTPAQSIAVTTPPEVKLYINQSSAKQLKLTIPQSLLDKVAAQE